MALLSVESAKATESYQADALTRATSVVGCEQGYEALRESLLGDVFLVETLDEAHRRAKDAPTHARFVTLEGDVVQGNGIVVGGLAKAAGSWPSNARCVSLSQW